MPGTSANCEIIKIQYRGGRLPKPVFPGFPPEALTFFAQLEKNNRREWFQPRKEVFETKVKAPMVDFVAAINEALQRFAPEYVTDPKKAIFRIYRDTRFSKDKTPYKTHCGALFVRRGTDKDRGGGLYTAINHKGLSIAGGVYDPDPKTLLAIRQHLAETHEEFRKLISRPAIRKSLGELQGDSLTRMPKGFAADHPAEELLRRKAFYFYLELDPKLATTPKALSEVLKRFDLVVPVVEHLVQPLAGKKKQAGPRFEVVF
jgi:uncharacterized protein (TIGR02453 family)